MVCFLIEGDEFWKIIKSLSKSKVVEFNTKLLYSDDKSSRELKFLN
jgi:hypothetical protein